MTTINTLSILLYFLILFVGNTSILYILYKNTLFPFERPSIITIVTLGLFSAITFMLIIYWTNPSLLYIREFKMT